jgi:hypothetical protein
MYVYIANVNSGIVAVNMLNKELQIAGKGWTSIWLGGWGCRAGNL